MAASKNNFLRARGIGAITPHDSNALEPAADALLCTVAGNAVITDLNGDISTVAMLAGQTLPVGVQLLAATGTTGTYFGLYE